MITHYTLEFNGSINRIFRFDVCNYNLHEYVYMKDDYLYIQNCRITNNKEGIHTIQFKMKDGYVGANTGESFVKNIFTIDYSGYVICTKHIQSSNKFDFFLSKLFG